MNKDNLLEKLENSEITHLEFLQKSEYAYDFKKWCAEHGEKPSEDLAAFFFDMAVCTVSEADKAITYM